MAPEPAEGPGAPRPKRRGPVSLTDVMVKALKPAADRYLVRDRDVPGLAVRVGSDVKTWLVYRTLNDRPIRVHLGRYPDVPLADARVLARGALALIAKGIDPRSYRPEQLTTITEAIADGGTATKAIEAADASGLTFGDLAEKFLVSPAVKGKPTEVETERHLRTYLMTPKPKRGPVSVDWTNMPVASLTPKVINPALDSLVPRGRVMASRVAQTLNRMLRWAGKKGHIDAVPMFDTTPGGAERSRDRVLTDRELKAVWHAATEPVFGPLVRLLIATGCRKGEARNMKWSHVDFEKKIWRQPKTKAGHSDEVPLSELALSILAEAKKQSVPDQGYVFSASGGPFGGFGKSTKRLRDAAKIDERWTLHDLRRSAATKMAEVGISKDAIRRVLGHAEGGITSTYVRASWIGEKRDALDRWAKHLKAIVK